MIAGGLLAMLATAATALLWSHLDQAMPARSAGLLLLTGAALAVALPGRERWHLRHPAPWLVGGLGLLALGWFSSPAPGPGVFRLVERTAALATALGVGALLARWTPAQRAEVLGVGAAAALLLNAVGQIPFHGMPLGIALGLGQDPPFGNTNFTTGALLPLLILGLTEPGLPRASRALIWAGGAAALTIGLGLVNGDSNRAALVGLLVAGGMVGVLRTPPRWHGPLIALALTIGVGLAAWLLLAEHYPALLGPSTGFRIGCWRAAFCAWTEAPFLGHGPGASLVVLNRQDDYQMAWLAVPGYTEHAHSEPLEILVEGGLALALVLAIALACLAVPLWRSRDQHRALLAAWAVAVVMGCLESHYGQPGPLLGLALLTGATLATRAESSTPNVFPRILGAVAALALSWSLIQELRWTIDGSAGHAAPPVAEVLSRRGIEADRAAGDWVAVDRRCARLIHDLGPLTDLWYQRAEAAARQKRNEEALAHTLRQAAVNPLIPGHLDLTDRLLPLARRRGWTDAVQRLEATQDHARRLIRRGQALGWRGKDPVLVAWLEGWALRHEGRQSSPRAASPSSP